MDCDKLITLVQPKTFLYDPKSPYYMDKDMRANAWQRIASEMDASGQYFVLIA
jgi:hypothetical protein